MKSIGLFLCLCFVAGFAYADNTFLEGKYRGPSGDSAGRNFEFSDGRFTCTYFTDAGRPALPQKGAYQIHGSRVYLIGDDPNFGEVIFFQTIDDVPVLLTGEMFAAYRATHRLTNWSGAYYVFFGPSSERDPDSGLWWRALLTKHPKFAELVAKKTQ